MTMLVSVVMSAVLVLVLGEELEEQERGSSRELGGERGGCTEYTATKGPETVLCRRWYDQ